MAQLYANHAAGTPPKTSYLQLHKQASHGKQRSSVVPFTRRTSRTSQDSEDYVGSFNGQGSAQQDTGSNPHTLSHAVPFRKASSVPRRPSADRSSPRPADSFTSLQQSVPLLRKPATSASEPGFRAEGFRTQQSSPTECRPPAAGSQQPFLPTISSAGEREGMLSRALSKDLLEDSPSFGSPAAIVLKKRLQKCLDKSPSYPPPVRPRQPSPAEVLGQLQGTHAVFQDPVVAQAFTLASCAFQENQLRPDGQSHLAHSAETAKILADLGLDAQTVAAGLLHDVLDFSMMTEDKLRQVVPKAVVDRVVNVCRMSEACQLLHDSADHRLEPEVASKLTTMLLAMADVRAVLVKLADRLHTLRHSAALPQKQQQRLAEETLHVFAPLANRLGVWSLKASLEDLSFKVLHPVQHAELEAALRESQHRGSIEASLGQLKAAMEAKELEYTDMSGRPKHLYGVYNKMAKKGTSLEDIYDVRALRVVVKTKHDCYKVLREVERLWQPVAGRFKDYIRQPKPNGYRSLHMVVRGADGVPIEVQVRTEKMHAIAEYGVAAHWRYKETSADSRDDYLEHLVSYNRWLITWGLELEDQMCRPNGASSPPREPPQLPAAVIGNIIGCTFPNHKKDCTFASFLETARNATPLLRKTAVPSPTLTPEASPAYVVLVNHSSASPASPQLPQVAIEQVPATATAGWLLRSGLAGANVPAGSMRLLVNNETVHDAALVLRNGDKVEIFQHTGMEVHPAQGSPFQLDLSAPAGAPRRQSDSAIRLDRERRRLDRLFSNSGELTSDQLVGLGMRS